MLANAIRQEIWGDEEVIQQLESNLAKRAGLAKQEPSAKNGKKGRAAVAAKIAGRGGKVTDG